MNKIHLNKDHRFSNKLTSILDILLEAYSE